MLNRKGFLMIESILLFQIAIILIMVISGSIKGIAHIKTTEINYAKDEESIREIFYTNSEESQ